MPPEVFSTILDSTGPFLSRASTPSHHRTQALIYAWSPRNPEAAGVYAAHLKAWLHSWEWLSPGDDWDAIWGLMFYRAFKYDLASSTSRLVSADSDFPWDHFLPFFFNRLQVRYDL